MAKTALSGGLVYSTELGRMCPGCREPIAACACAAAAARRVLPADGVATIRREVGGRGGKTVTVIRGLALDDTQLTALAKRLKAACATGGAVKDGVLELQGDHVDKLVTLLGKEGLKSKRGGG